MSFVSGDPTTSVPITGEAVAVELRLSRFPSRTVGLFLDLLVQIPLLLVVVGLAGWAASGLDSAAGAAIVLVGVVGVLIGYPALVETLSHGRSLGKLAMGMRVVRDDGGPVRFRHSFVRALFMLIDFWLTSGCVGLFSSLASASGKRLGDHVAGTVVVLERVPAAATQLGRVFMPPGLEGWAATLDLRALPDATATQARQFLSRANEFTPEVRASLGQQLAYEVAATVVPYPPAGVPAEVYLAAVIAERTRRAYALAPPPQYPPPTYPSPPAVQVPAYSPPATEVPPTPAPAPSTPGPPAPPDTGFTVPR